MSEPKSSLNCPCCGKPLSKREVGATVELWCGYGPCPSLVMNFGSEGFTEDEAFEKLEKAHKAWPCE